MKASRGFTLVETMVACAVLSLAVLALFEGLTLAARLSRENAELLQAESVAWDAVWAAFNEDYDALLSECRRGAGGVSVRTVALSDEAAPLLSRYDAAPTLSVTLTKTDVAVDSGEKSFVAVEGDVTWGPVSGRRSLSSVQRTWVYRGPVGRVETY
jgi:prepilin-type N-terminal cleavage/methylation domain-containing protein